MKPLKNSGGVWEAEIKNIKPYDMYKYCITAADGRTLMKCDPYGFHMETRPGTATKYYEIDDCYEWHDEKWVEGRNGKARRNVTLRQSNPLPDSPTSRQTDIQ